MIAAQIRKKRTVNYAVFVRRTRGEALRTPTAGTRLRPTAAQDALLDAAAAHFGAEQ